MSKDPSDAPLSPHSAKGRLPPNVRVLGVVSLLNDIASEMIYPLLPTFLMQSLGGDRFTLGLMEAISESVSSLLKPVFGILSDQARSRKGYLVFGYGVATLVRPLIGVVTLPWQLLGLRLGDRIGKGVRTSPRDALIADSTPAENRGRAFGFHRSMDHLGAAIGPLLAAAYLAAYPGEYRTLFLLTIIPGLLVLTAVLLGVREVPRAEAEDPQPTPAAGFSFDRSFASYLAILALFTLGNASDMFLLVRLGELGISPAMIPLVWCLFHVIKSAGANWAGPWADRLGSRRMIVSGWVVYALVYLGFAAAESALVAVGLFFAYGIFYSLTEPAEKKLVADLVGADQRGAAFGWFHFAVGIAAFPASLLFGFLYQTWGPWVSFGTSAALALSASMALMLLPMKVARYRASGF